MTTTRNTPCRWTVHVVPATGRAYDLPCSTFAEAADRAYWAARSLFGEPARKVQIHDDSKGWL